MSPVSCVLMFSAFVVGFSSGEDAASKSKFLKLCRNAFKEDNITDVYLSDDYFCTTYCSGPGTFKALNKTDGTHCQAIYPTDNNTRECFAGECQLRSDVNLCMNTLTAPVRSVAVTGCNVTCTSDGDYVINLKRPKPEGSPCQSPLYWVSATCDKNAVCQENMVYVSDVKGQDASKTPEEKSLATCQERHVETSEVQTYFVGDKCGFLCAYNGSKKLEYEFLFYKDGYNCEKDSVCLRGQCRSNSFIQECQNAVSGNLISIDDDQCEYSCVTKTEGGQTMVTRIMKPSGTQCKKTPEGSYVEQTGTCDNDRICNVTKA